MLERVRVRVSEDAVRREFAGRVGGWGCGSGSKKLRIDVVSPD